MTDSYDEDEQEVAAPVEEVARVLYNAMSPNWEIDFEGGYYAGAQALLDSRWFRDQLADAFDDGVRTGGKHGHDDYWDDDNDPYAENPWRTKEERELGL